MHLACDGHPGIVDGRYNRLTDASIFVWFDEEAQRITCGRSGRRSAGRHAPDGAQHTPCAQHVRDPLGITSLPLELDVDKTEKRNCGGAVSFDKRTNLAYVTSGDRGKSDRTGGVLPSESSGERKPLTR
jgi:hypothetical protein